MLAGCVASRLALALGLLASGRGDDRGHACGPAPDSCRRHVPGPEQVTGYICPMHPDVVESAPGKCPRCGMTLVPGNPLGTANYRLAVETVPAW